MDAMPAERIDLRGALRFEPSSRMAMASLVHSEVVVPSPLTIPPAPITPPPLLHSPSLTAGDVAPSSPHPRPQPLEPSVRIEPPLPLRPFVAASRPSHAAALSPRDLEVHSAAMLDVLRGKKH